MLKRGCFAGLLADVVRIRSTRVLCPAPYCMLLILDLRIVAFFPSVVPILAW